jgi:hypothetical protein
MPANNPSTDYRSNKAKLKPNSCQPAFFAELFVKNIGYAVSERRSATE